MPKRLLVAVAVLCLAAIAPVSAALSKTTRASTHAAVLPYSLGIADNVQTFMADPRFKALGIKHARIDLEWDALTNNTTRSYADSYMNAARADGVDVLVTFDHSRLPGGNNNPSPAQLVAAMKAMHSRWPWVKEFSTWNEVNLSKKGNVIAKWWMALNKAKCPGCTILGADLVDRAPTGDSPAQTTKSFATFFKAFFKTTKGKQPAVWGLHNYVDVNLKRTTGTKLMLKDVKGQIWFTETGGLVKRTNKSVVKFPEGQTHATNATKYLLTKLARLSPRIKRVYIYQWIPSADWDSAFVSATGKTRPTLTYLASLLGKKLP